MKILVVLSLIKRLIQEVIKFMRISPGSSLSIGVMRFIARDSHPVGSIKAKEEGHPVPDAGRAALVWADETSAQTARCIVVGVGWKILC